MIIGRAELKEIILEVAKEQFTNNEFPRRPLMNAVEERVRYLGFWEDRDDRESSSTGEKSKGLEVIDYAISSLKDKGLKRLGHDRWIVE